MSWDKHSSLGMDIRYINAVPDWENLLAGTVIKKKISTIYRALFARPLFAMINPHQTSLINDRHLLIFIAHPLNVSKDRHRTCNQTCKRDGATFCLPSYLSLPNSNGGDGSRPFWWWSELMISLWTIILSRNSRTFYILQHISIICQIVLPARVGA